MKEGCFIYYIRTLTNIAVRLGARCFLHFVSDVCIAGIKMNKETLCCPSEIRVRRVPV